MKEIKLFVATSQERSEDIVFGGEKEEEWELGDSKEPCAGVSEIASCANRDHTGAVGVGYELCVFCDAHEECGEISEKNDDCNVVCQGEPARCRLTSDG
jgi:hypothetical protein